MGSRSCLEPVLKMTITKGSTSFLLKLPPLSSVPPALGTLTMATALGLGDEGLLIGTRHGLMASPFAHFLEILSHRWKDSLWKLHPLYIILYWNRLQTVTRLWIPWKLIASCFPTFHKFLSISNHNNSSGAWAQSFSDLCCVKLERHRDSWGLGEPCHV